MAGSIASFDQMLKRLYTSDKVQNLVYEDNPLLSRIRRDQATLPNAGGFISREAPGAIGTATVLVCTSVVALEWLRRRKAEVAAAEHDEAAFESLLDEFVAWLAALLVRMGLREAA